MRKREIKKNFYLNYRENDELRKKAMKVGLTESELIRNLIKGYYPKEKPGKEFYNELQNLRTIGRNINQLAKYANSYGKLNEHELIMTKDKLDKLIYELEQKYLLADKNNFL